MICVHLLDLQLQLNRLNRQNRDFTTGTKNHRSEVPLRSERKIKPLKQKTKDRLAVIGLLALEAFFIFGSVSNFYRYIFLKIDLDIYLAILSTILAAILFVFIIVIIVSYLDKRKVLKSFQKSERKDRKYNNGKGTV